MFVAYSPFLMQERGGNVVLDELDEIVAMVKGGSS